jgi:pimeloyl-[acyl-carrier protein] synthase
VSQYRPVAHSVDPSLSLYHLMDPLVLADPYPLYHRLRSEAPVHWDPYLHSWVVTRYAEVIFVLQHFSARCAPTPEQLAAIGMPALAPIAHMLMRQMLFQDPPVHTRVRNLAAKAFTPRRVERLRGHICDITDSLVREVIPRGRMDVIGDIAEPLPAIVTTELLGLPREDWKRLKTWSTEFAKIIGNFQLNPDQVARVMETVEEMADYFREAVRREDEDPTSGIVNALATAELDGDRFTEEEVIANLIITLVGGLETTTNLIGNGLLSLLRNPDQHCRLRSDASLMASAVEELLRYESPSQQTARLAPYDIDLGGRLIRKGQTVIVVMGAANRDPERFTDPDRLDLGRQDNRHVAFGWASHFCFGAPLGRMEGQIAFEAIMRLMPKLKLEVQPIIWREHLGLRGLKGLQVVF